METNKYHALCSNEILKAISSLLGNDSILSSLSDNYNSYFKKYDKVNFIWPLVSTSLLMSENLYKYDKSYKLISENTLDLINDKLYLYPLSNLYEQTASPCLLDDHNNVASVFLTYLKCDFEQLDYFKETLERLREDSTYGCNDSIIENGLINIRKFVERTRNALAHSNYEIIDEDNIRLYHYNTNTKKMDFNVIVDPSVIVLIVDELNEIASNKYTNFMSCYSDPFGSLLLNAEITDERIIKYMLSFDIFDEEVALNILNDIKNNEEFLNTTDEDKVAIINEAIYEKIKPVYDVGIILNDYLYCDEKGKILADELYEKYDTFNYLNSDYYNTTEGNVNDNIYLQNKFKFLLLSLLNCSLLNSYNAAEGRGIGIIDLSKMTIDGEILKGFFEKNALKTLNVIDLLEKEIEKNKKEIEEKTTIIDKKHLILKEHNIDNDYFNIVLPSQIKELEKEKIKITTSNISRELELEKAKQQGGLYNYDKNISQFVFNHLRNSLAHGYVKFPNDFNLSNVSDVIITFEDYNPDNKKELTFRGTIKLGDLLTIITSNEYVNNILSNHISNACDVGSLIYKEEMGKLLIKKDF